MYFFTIVITVLLAIGGLFYWFQVRPSMTKAACNTKARDEARVRTKEAGHPENGKFERDLYDPYFKRCLNANGL
jgi:hypothetical protein